MKYVSLFFAAAASLFSATMQAQNPVPAGFSKAIVELNKGTVLSGYAKDNIKKSSAIIFIDSAGNKKVYDGNDVSTLTIDTVHFICIRGDFFKVICSGKIDFLQKAGNASANPTYNGAEAMFTNGTEGKPGDYFVYTNRKLQLLNKKNMDAFINTELAACTEAMQKAKASNGDMSKMGEAVETFNNYAVK
jgi:hypothetical protein